MSFITDQEADQHPPVVATINVLTLAAATASVAQLAVSNGGTTLPGARPRFVTFVCDQVFGITFGVGGNAAGPADPVIASTAGDSRTMVYPANTPVRFRIDPAHRFFKAISTPGGTLRWYESEGPRTI